MNCTIDTGIVIGISAVMSAFLIWAFTKLDSDIKSLDGDIKSLSSKIDDNMRSQTQRTDQLYQMFIDLLKSQNPKTDP